jgi:hypothetical protein
MISKLAVDLTKSAKKHNKLSSQGLFLDLSDKISADGTQDSISIKRLLARTT